MINLKSIHASLVDNFVTYCATSYVKHNTKCS